MDAALLDTDMLSELLKQQNRVVAQQASIYLQTHGLFTFSAFTWFEIRRGYKEKRAIRQLARFNAFCQQSRILPVTDAVFERATELWVMARQVGHPHGDADLLIAATALENGLTLATGNTKHFQWIPGLVVTDWRAS
jgi:tRNA(fMet)-specific endonuclease VapC